MVWWFKQYTKCKYEIDIGPLFGKETMTGTDESNTKDKKRQQDLLWALGPEATHQITRSKQRTNPGNFKIDKLIELYNRHYVPKRNKYKSRDFFWAKQRYRDIGRTLKFLELEKECICPEISTELPISKIITSITDRKLRDKLLKEKKLDVP